MEQQNNKEGIEKEIEKRIERGDLGNLDYEWDGNSVIKDNIVFERKEFFDLIKEIFKRGSQSKEKEMLDDEIRFLEDTFETNICYHTFLEQYPEEKDRVEQRLRKLKGAEEKWKLKKKLQKKLKD